MTKEEKIKESKTLLSKVKREIMKVLVDNNCGIVADENSSAVLLFDFNSTTIELTIHDNQFES